LLLPEEEFHPEQIFAGGGRANAALSFSKCAMTKIEDLKALAQLPLETARALPPGSRRNEALDDIGKLRPKPSALQQRHGAAREIAMPA
jgi:hypothetical protein